ncbi:hypothetical protein BCU39_013085 [Vibrio cyclitrophicus]|uniref:hypothetical protein n=1 Tax=Vibrio cyclitrophicus TaxID=47951 RepID=UPI000C831073|nr:hypothetical protein [Vibrio cyclitrophicus]PMI68179.1 hypothetical protein BCU39_13220 [Vibrio cyclitrophicus]
MKLLTIELTTEFTYKGLNTKPTKRETAPTLYSSIVSDLRDVEVVNIETGEFNRHMLNKLVDNPTPEDYDEPMTPDKIDQASAVYYAAEDRYQEAQRGKYKGLTPEIATQVVKQGTANKRQRMSYTQRNRVQPTPQMRSDMVKWSKILAERNHTAREVIEPYSACPCCEGSGVWKGTVAKAVCVRCLGTGQMSTADWKRYHNYCDLRAQGRLSTSNAKHRYVALQPDANSLYATVH